MREGVKDQRSMSASVLEHLVYYYYPSLIILSVSAWLGIRLFVSGSAGSHMFGWASSRHFCIYLRLCLESPTSVLSCSRIALAFHAALVWSFQVATRKYAMQ